MPPLHPASPITAKTLDRVCNKGTHHSLSRCDRRCKSCSVRRPFLDSRYHVLLTYCSSSFLSPCVVRHRHRRLLSPFHVIAVTIATIFNRPLHCGQVLFFFQVVNIKAIVRAQRVATLRVTRAYRTVSADAALFLADIPPGDLLALERSRVRCRLEEPDRTGTAAVLTAEERKITVGGWQARWNRSANAEWTRAILLNVVRWIARSRMDLTFHLTQALTSHGCFRHYLHRMKRAPDGRCLYCQDPSDRAEHSVFYCVSLAWTSASCEQDVSHDGDNHLRTEGAGWERASGPLVFNLLFLLIYWIIYYLLNYLNLK